MVEDDDEKEEDEEVEKEAVGVREKTRLSK